MLDLDPEVRLTRQLELLDTRWDASWREANPEMVRTLREGFQLSGAAGAGADTGLRLQLEARRHHDTTGRLSDIHCSTLVCGGRYDGIAPPANSQFLARTIPGARLEMFDGGHVFMMQDPAAFPTMLAFLRDEPAAAAAP
jgi:3-oxoadipate enol-lactonase